MESGLATAIDSALFDDYQRELESLETFRERYRHLYPFAGLERDDPDVQRLLEGLAFFTARTRRAADRALAGYERRALEQVFPHLVTPLPSMAMLTVDGAERMIEPRTLPAGTEVAVSARPDGAPGRAPAAISYRTLRDVIVRPFDLDRPRIKLARIGDEGYELVIPIRSATPRSEAVETIELHLDPHGDLLAALRLHHALARHVETAHYVFPGTTQPARRVRSMAFAALPGEADGFANPLERFRSLVHFPLAALAVRFTIDQTPAAWQRLELRLRIAPAWPRELSVPPGVFVLHATPMINLRRELADPVALDGTKARLEVAHPEPSLELRPRELLAVYRSTTGGLVPLLPEALAAPDDDWYAAEVAGRHTARQVWLDVHAPGAFAARAAIIADVDWYHPGAGRLLRGPLDARLTGRHLEGARCRVIAPIEPALDSPLAGRRDKLSRLLALAGRSDLDAPSLSFLLDVLGCAEHELFQRVARAIASLAVTRQADARAPSGMRTTLDVVLARLPLALVPAADLLLSRLPDLLAAWSGDEPPIVRVRIEGDEDDLTATYRSESNRDA
jgi:type VI secretion system protein ImpG